MGIVAPERVVMSMYGVERKEMEIVDQEEGKKGRKIRKEVLKRAGFSGL